MAGYGVSIGHRVRVSFVKSGVNNRGNQWQMFTYTESRKNQTTGNYDQLGKYTVFCNNIVPNLKDGDYVTINSITKVLIDKSVYNGREFTNVTLSCNVTPNAPYTPNLVGADETRQNQQQGFTNPYVDNNVDYGDLGNFDVSVDDSQLPF